MSMIAARTISVYSPSGLDELDNQTPKRTSRDAGIQIRGTFRFLSKDVNAKIKQVVPIRVQLELWTDPMKYAAAGVATIIQVKSASFNGRRFIENAKIIVTAAKSELNKRICITLFSTSAETKFLMTSE